MLVRGLRSLVLRAFTGNRIRMVDTTLRRSDGENVMFDPTDCLNTIMRLTRRVKQHQDLTEEVSLLANLIDTLNTWLISGGALPEQWK